MKKFAVASVFNVVLLIATALPVQPASPAKAAARTAAPVKAAALSGTANWIEYHHDRSRRGLDPSQPNFSTLSPAWTNSTLTGQIYASPLVYNGSVYIATEDNVIYALDPATGTVQWSKTLSTPFDSSGLPCGNVSPMTCCRVTSTGTGRFLICASRSRAPPASRAEQHT